MIATDLDLDLALVVDLDATVPCGMDTLNPCPNPATWRATPVHPDGTRCTTSVTSCDHHHAAVTAMTARPDEWVITCRPHKRDECTLEWRRL